MRDEVLVRNLTPTYCSSHFQIPGAASEPHRHAQSAFLYVDVVEGAIESTVIEQEARIYNTSGSWSDAPGDLYTVIRHVSKAEPAKLSAVFVADSTDIALTVPAK